MLPLSTAEFGSSRYGIDPDIAVASPMAAYVLYLAPGVTPHDLPDKFGTVTLDD